MGAIRGHRQPAVGLLPARHKSRKRETTCAADPTLDPKPHVSSPNGRRDHLNRGAHVSRNTWQTAGGASALAAPQQRCSRDFAQRGSKSWCSILPIGAAALVICARNCRGALHVAAVCKRGAYRWDRAPSRRNIHCPFRERTHLALCAARPARFHPLLPAVSRLSATTGRSGVASFLPNPQGLPLSTWRPKRSG